MTCRDAMFVCIMAAGESQGSTITLVNATNAEGQQVYQYTYVGNYNVTALTPTEAFVR